MGFYFPVNIIRVTGKLLSCWVQLLIEKLSLYKSGDDGVVKWSFNPMCWCDGEYFVARRGDLFVAFPRIIGSIIHRVPATHASISRLIGMYTDTDVFWPDKKVNPSLISGIMILYLGFRLQRKPDNCCDHWLDCRPQTQEARTGHTSQL